MLRKSTPFFVFVLGLCLIGVLDNGRTSGTRLVEHNPDSPDEFARYFRDIRTAEGESGPSYRPGYRMQALEQMRFNAKGGQTVLPWKERGPGNVGGRTRALIVDRADPTRATWIAGSVGGGIWRTTNKGLQWTSLTDHLPRLAIGSLAQSPSNPLVMYAGTGEGYRNADASIGDGMFKSEDGGLTWQLLTSTMASYDFLFVNRIIISDVDPGVVLVATNSGIHRTLDGGSTWTRVKATTGLQGFYQILHQPGNFSIQYAAESGRGIWKSTDAGLNWVQINTGIQEASSNVRIELDISPVSPERVFAFVEKGDGPDRLYISNTAGQVWTLFEDSNTVNPFNIAGDQGWYDLMVKAHPFNEDIVFLGGIGMYRATISGESTSSQFTVAQNNTASFLTFTDFGGGHLGGGLRLGTDEDESTITAENMVPVEVRFGPGKSQRAHRFVPPDLPGIAFSAYPYRDYATVPFEVWDTKNDRQLMVSFRDRNDNGAFDLIERSTVNVGREYVVIHARPYNAQAPDPEIARDGGIVSDLAYFFWPALANGATWSPNALPESSLAFYWADAIVATGSITSIGAGVHADQHVMIVTPSGGTNFEIVLGNDGGVYYSGDGGSNWIERSRGYNTSQYYGMDKKPGADAYLGGTQDNGSWRSFVNPTSSQFWLNAGSGDGFEAVWHKQNDQKMLVTSQWNWFQRSLNGGQSWLAAGSGLTDAASPEQGAQFYTVVDQDPENSDRLYTVGKSGVWTSSDFAQTWQSTAIAEADWGFERSAKIRVSLNDPEVVWAGSEMDAVPGGSDPQGKLHVSTNAGGLFQPVPTPSIAPGRLSGLATSFDEAGTVYAVFSASNRAKIIRSTDFGQTWTDLSGFDPGPAGLVSQNGFPDVSVYDLLDFPNSDRLWAATEIGIIESLDNGVSWMIADNGLPAVAVAQLRLLDGQILAATHGRGIWTLQADQVLPVFARGTGLGEDELPSVFQMDSIYPNPVTTSATLSWRAGSPGVPTVRILDLQGRLVRSIPGDFVSAGAHQWVISASDLAAGAYFLSLEFNGKTVSRPFVRIR